MFIGNRIKDLRLQYGYRQSDLASRIGCSTQVISNIERGYTSVSVDMIGKISECFGVSSDFFIENSETYDIKLSKTEKDLVIRFRKMTQKEKKILLGILDLTADE